MYADGVSFSDPSGRVIGCAFTVLNTPGAGFCGKGPGECADNRNMCCQPRSCAAMQGVRNYYNDVVVGE